MRSKVARKFGARTRDRWYSTLSLAGVAVMMLVLAGCDGGGGSSDSARANVGTSPTDGIFPSADVLCGAGEECVITAGRTIPVGTMTVNNDEDNIYIKVELVDGWVIKGVNGGSKVWVGTGDHPDDGRPNAGSFCDPQNEEGHPYWCQNFTQPVASTDYAIPFTDIIVVDGVEYLGCPQELFIYLHLDVALLDDNGNEIQSETAFGGCIEGTGRGAWFFYSTYTTVCCEDDPGGDGGFRTQTMGGWGAPCHGQNPGCYRDANFDGAFPDGIVLGCDTSFDATFTSAGAVEAYLPGGGQPGPLTGDLVDPVGSTSAGVLLGQLLAATLNVGFDAYDPDFGESDDLLGDQIVCNTGNAAVDALGLSVAELIADAESFVGGCGSAYGLNRGALVTALTAINENYHEGDLDLGYLCNP